MVGISADVKVVDSPEAFDEAAHDALSFEDEDRKSLDHIGQPDYAPETSSNLWAIRREEKYDEVTATS
jgi:hypothetical protein